MTNLLKIFLSALVFIGFERGIRTQTHGFRIEKTHSDFPAQISWETDLSSSNLEILNQPFYFLGSGVQCYAFLSADQTTVLKIFKHYHLFPSSTVLQKLALPSPLRT